MSYVGFAGVSIRRRLRDPSVVTIDRIAAGWTALTRIFYAAGVWLALGTSASPGSNYIYRSTDFIVWTRVDVGQAGSWEWAMYDQGAWVLVKGTAAVDVNKVRRSTDDGLTWVEVTIPVSPTTVGSAYGGNGRMVIGGAGTPDNISCYSTDGGATWTSLSQLSNFQVLALGSVIGLGTTSVTSSTVYISTTNGASWINDDSNWPINPSTAVTYKGRLVVSFSGVATTVRYRDPGGSWVTAALPASVTNGVFMVIANVLYLVSSSGGTPLYSTDGTTWKECTGVAFLRFAVIDRGLNQPITFMPGWSKPTDPFPELARYPLAT